jgi:hypothetical protein
VNGRYRHSENQLTGLHDFQDERLNI